MEEMKNQTIEEMLIAIKDFPYEPIFNRVVITLNKEESIGLDISENSLDESQYLIAGTITYGNTTIVPGDKVLLDLEALQVSVRTETNNAYETNKQVKVDPIFVNDRMYAIINDRVVKAKYKN